MDVLGIVGSSRKGGNTDILVRKVLDGVEKKGFSTSVLYLSDHTISDCTGCEGCQQSFRCIVNDDMQTIYPLLENVKGLVLGSPTYFYNVSGIMKCFLDRLYCYEFFDKHDRSVWLGLNEITGIKYAITVAVCEQDNEADMGFTSEALGRSLAAIGFRIIGAVKAFHAFSKGDVSRQVETLAGAEQAGARLADTITLNAQVKHLLIKSKKTPRTPK